jgi:hypothetical protein
VFTQATGGLQGQFSIWAHAFRAVVARSRGR